ncbi:DMT family transporter [Cupriavidus sp. AU9028]|nr:DMT family transporter [Cupriavidus sp. AU9028]
MPLPLLETVLIVTWSSGFVGARFSLDHAPAMLVVFWRCVLVSLVLLPFVIAQLRTASRAALLRSAAVGLFSMGGYLAGVVKGIELGVPAGLAALLADLLPLGVALLATVVLRQRLPARAWLGLATGVAGVVLVTHDVVSVGKAPLWAYGLPLLGMLSLAVATLWQKTTKGPDALGLLPNLWMQCLVSALAFAGLAGMEGSLMPVANAGFALSVLWTAAFSTLGGYGIYWLCLRRSSATRVATVLYLSPAVTMLWAWAMFGEPLSWTMALGAATSALGVWMVAQSRA